MDLRLLEIFCLVCEEKSFSRAAERLRLSQPTVSSHVKRLERQVGATLLDRMAREVVPTRVGALLYEHGLRIVRAKRELMEQIDRYLNRLQGELLVAASTIPGEYLLVPIIGEFCALYPGIELRLLICDTLEVLESVDQGRVELGFAGGKRLTETNLAFQDFAEDRLVLVAPADARWAKVTEIGLERLMREPLVVREPGSGTRMMFERRLEELGRDPRDLKVVAQVGSSSAIKRAVRTGLGLSVVSHLAVQDELRAGQLKVIDVREIGRLERRFFVVTHRARMRSPLGEALLAWLTARGPLHIEPVDSARRRSSKKPI
jgi:DNA-binding transcriptional LysR family regulator